MFYFPTENVNPLYAPIRITTKLGKARKGHPAHRSGSGSHNTAPKRLRTRKAQLNKAIKEYD